MVSPAVPTPRVGAASDRQVPAPINVSAGGSGEPDQHPCSPAGGSGGPVYPPADSMLPPAAQPEVWARLRDSQTPAKPPELIAGGTSPASCFVA